MRRDAGAALSTASLACVLLAMTGCSGDPERPTTPPPATTVATVAATMAQDPVAAVFGSDTPSEQDIATIERQLDEIDDLLDGLDAELQSD